MYWYNNIKQYTVCVVGKNVWGDCTTLWYSIYYLPDGPTKYGGTWGDDDLWFIQAVGLMKPSSSELEMLDGHLRKKASDQRQKDLLLGQRICPRLGLNAPEFIRFLKPPGCCCPLMVSSDIFIVHFFYPHCQTKPEKPGEQGLSPGGSGPSIPTS